MGTRPLQETETEHNLSMHRGLHETAKGISLQTRETRNQSPGLSNEPSERLSLLSRKVAKFAFKIQVVATSLP